MALKDTIELIKSWPLKRKIALVSAIFLSFALMVGIVLWTERVDYQVLYSNLSQEDAGQVIAKLKEMKIPYKVEGNVIYVPSNRVYELRLELAAQGIPSGGGVGFEIFDKTQIGVTEFVQRLNYIRAIQGELTRTIRQLAEVDQARVHIAIPEKTIFTEKEDKPTASVVLKLKPGRVLSQGQIGGIVHLVSSSVEGMQPQNVTIIDNMGNLLSKPVDTTDEIVDSKKIEYQKAVDKDYESKLQSMLEGIIGRGKAIVRVSTKIDFTQVERTEEKFDPDTIAVRNEQRTQEKSVGATQGGIPGVLSNQPGQQPTTATGSPSTAQKQSENLNYEVSRSVSKIIQPRGEVKSVSVAVLIDGTYKKEKDKKVYVPRTEEDMKKYREIVMAAIGYNKDRGDQVIVENVPFEVAIEELPPEKIDFVRLALSLLKYIIPLIVIVLLIFFVIKPVIETLKVPVIKKVPEEIMPTTPPVEAVPEAAPEEVMKEEVAEIIKKEPRRAAMILKEWLSE
ncbi:flagellar M-ring protein [Dissulfurispira thermophila]|uniref:Flagellar M-ring protein n=1 Tax=Dissulfurispira thermophila TaxID=2715679 RepID=A0A7G1H140_9BACT|nr:flagellar basal-body MS-ring/collar protein FliF [Dissulfurispira thermophila]BCB96474.1 flagellar M-ring protein [Dissulfurispira thermophila]